MDRDLTYYEREFVKLRVDNSRGVAPHKPILLLAIIDLFEHGKLSRNEIHLSPELIANFLKFWNRFVATDHHSDIALPFFHLTGKNRTGNTFWYLMPNPGFETTIKSKARLRSLSALRAAVKYAYLDKELFEFLSEPESRIKLTAILIQAWFPGQKAAVEETFNYDQFEDIQLRLFEAGGATYGVEELKEEEQIFVRNAAFRRNVIKLYDQRCSFCKMRVVSWDGQDLVDGAHIQPFAEFHNDLLVNGIALCKNHHWAFDHGWMGVSDDYQIIVPSDRITEDPQPGIQTIADLDGVAIAFPNKEEYLPNKEALAWHRDRWKIA